MKTIIKKYYFYLILLLCLLPAVVPVFKPYVSGTADGLGHRFRLVSFYNSLNQGIMRPRWAGEAALGYGAPTFLFNYPLPYYLASLILKAGFSVNQSGQLLSAAALLLSGFAMYILGKKLTGEKIAGLVASVVYVYAPYHLLMTYLYDAWGEILAFIFPPLILYFIFKLNNQAVLEIQKEKSQIQNPKSQTNPKSKIQKIISYLNLKFYLKFELWNWDFILLILSWFLFILSHNVSAVMFAPILLLFAFVFGGFKIKPFIMILNTFILGVIISAFFWLPAFVLQNEMRYPQFLAGESVMRGSFFKSFTTLINNATQVIRNGIANYSDFTVGWPILFISVLSLFVIVYFIYRKVFTGKSNPERTGKRMSNLLQNKKIIQIVWILIVFLFSLYLVNYLSNWLWGFIYFHFTLYPFRFLFPATFLGSMMGALLVSQIFNNSLDKTGQTKKILWLTGIATITVFSVVQGMPYTKPYIDIFPFPDSYFFQRQTVTSAPGTRKNMLIKEFLPLRADDSFLNEEEARDRREEMVITKGLGTIRIVGSGSEKISARIEAKDNITATVNRFYFPNWKVYDRGVQIPIEWDSNGRILLSLDPGNHNLQLIFTVSGIEKIGYLITLLGLIILFWEIRIFR